MPRKSINQSHPKDFEPKKKNPISLGNDSNIDNDFKPFRIGGIDTGLEFKKGEIKSSASNFITLQETTEILNVTKIKGNRSGSQEVPNFIFQNPEPTAPDVGLWVNVATGGLSILRSYGSAAHMVQQSESSFFFVGGADDGDLVRWQRGTSWLTPDSTAMQLDLYNANLTIYDRADDGDYFKIDVTTHGATTISTVDDDATAAHLTLNADGYTQITIGDGNDDDIRITNDGQISHSFYSESGAESIFKMYEAGGDSSTDFFQISAQANGATILSTTDGAAASAHLTLDPDGDLILSGCDVKMDGGEKFYFDGGSHTWIGEQSSDLLNFAVGGQNLMAIQESAATSVAQSSKVYTACPILLKDIGGVADTPISGYGSLYVNSDVLYFKTDGGTATNLLSGGGGTSRWHTELGGYRTNNTSTTTYYTFYRKWYDNWSNSDSSPTSINVYDSPSVAWIAPADCTVTNFRVVGYCNDTGATDPFKFYIYKGTTAHDATSTSLTLVANTDAISCAAALRAFNESKDISSGNSISAGEQLYVFLKKDSNTGNQDLYFNIVMSGEYS
jgi:hypothetical protein